MPKLTSSERKKLPASDFGVPSKRKYPIPDKGHAEAALARVAEFGTPAQKKEVRDKVHSKYPGMGKK